MKAKLHIQNDGQPGYMTKVTDAETGKELDWHIFRIELDARGRKEPPTAIVYCYMPAIDIIADAEIRHVCPCCGKPEEEQAATEQKLIEQLADKVHESWSHWMRYLFSQCEKQPDGSMLIPLSSALRWNRQMATPYAELTEREKQSDRDEVAHILPIIDTWVKSEEEQSNANSH